jgi:photosystem II stability/assembly factor-like uncharacterized protein
VIFRYFRISYGADMKNLRARNQQKLHLVRKILTLFLLFLAILVIAPKPVFAHTPHDDIRDIEISPEYDQDKTVFTISRLLLLKSTNDGQTWQRLVKGLDNKKRLTSLDISPQNKQILFLASRDGIYKSQDGGISWSKSNKGLSILDINNIRVSPSSSDIVFATGLQLGLFRTLNGGETWSQVADPSLNVTAIAFLPDQTTTIMIGDHKGHLYRSDNNGETWKKVSSIADSGAIRTIAISPKFESDKTFFVGTERNGIFKTNDAGKSFSTVNSGLSDLSITSISLSLNYEKDLSLWSSSWDEGVFFSRDGGKSWKKQSEGLTKNSQGDEDDFKRPHFSTLKISGYGQNQTILLGGFNGLFQSKNSGKNWREIETISPSVVVGSSISPNYQKDSTIAITTYINGPHLSENGGLTWKAIYDGLVEKEFRSEVINRNDYIARLFNIVFSPNYQIDNTVFTTSKNHFLRSKNRGKKWEKIPYFRRKIWNLSENLSKKNFARRVCIIGFSPNYLSDKTIYVGTQNGEFFRSIDRGTNFSIIGNVPHGIVSLVTALGSSSVPIIYAGTENGIYITEDGGYHWRSSSTQVKNIKNLAISPNYASDKIIFAGTQDGLFITENAGNNWAKLNGTLYGENSSIEAVAVSPDYQNDRTLLISVKGKGLFKSMNNGRSFTGIGRDLINGSQLLDNFSVPTAVPIQFSPSYSVDHTIYGFSGIEVFKSTDRGDTWAKVTPPKAIYHVDRKSTDNSLFLAFPVREFLAALTATLFGFWALSYFPRGKSFFRKLNIKLGFCLIVFSAVFFILWLL